MPKDRFYRRRARTRIYWDYTRLPEIWTCPRCAENSVSVSVTDSSRVRVHCVECKLGEYFDEIPAYEDVDYYNKFTDAYYHDLATTLRGLHIREEKTSPMTPRISQIPEEVQPADIYQGGEYVFVIVKDYLVEGRVNGVAKVKNVVIFVPGARKGEVVKAKVKNFVDRAFGIAELMGRIS